MGFPVLNAGHGSKRYRPWICLVWYKGKNRHVTGAAVNFCQLDYRIPLNPEKKIFKVFEGKKKKTQL